MWNITFEERKGEKEPGGLGLDGLRREGWVESWDWMGWGGKGR